VAPEEEGELRSIERALGKRLPRVIVPDFDYKARPTTRFEVPLAERIAAIRAKKAEDRARSQAKAARRTSQTPGGRTGPPSGRPARNGQRNRPRNGGASS
jgi:ATP-dependent RNA helicase RhlE